MKKPLQRCRLQPDRPLGKGPARPAGFFNLAKTVVIFCIIANFAPHHFAQTRTWTHGAGTSNWGDSNNWSNRKIPNTASQAAAFGTTAPNSINQNVSGLLLGEFIFDSGGIARTITGNPVTLYGISSVGIANNSSLSQTIDVGLTLAGAQTFQAGSAGLSLGGALDLSSYALTVTGSGSSTFGGVISGSGSLSLADTGTLTLSGANTYSGGTLISNGGIIAISADNNLGNSAGALTFNNGDLQLGAGITSSRNVTLNSGGGTIDTGANSSTFSGVFSGTGSLTKIGGGTLTLSGVNTYSGGTIINAGTLSVSSDSNLGAASGSLTLNGGTLLNTSAFSSSRNVTLGSSGGAFDTAANLTLSGVISGAGALTKTGTGTLYLQSGNSYSGATAISQGTLEVSANGALGSGFGSAAVSSGASLAFGGNVIYYTPEPVTINGTGASSQGAIYNDSGNNVFTGNIALGSNSSIGANSGSLTLAGIISGSSALTKSGSGMVILAGNNTYSGVTTVAGGYLIVAANNALGSTAGGTVVNSGTTLGFAGGINYSAAENVAINGTGVAGEGAIWNSSGNNTFAGPITLASASLVTAASGTALTLSGAMDTTSSGYALSFGGAGTITASGAIAGTGSVTRQDSGTLVLSGNNTFTGGLNINSGTVQLGASERMPNTETVNILSGGTFDLQSYTETVGALNMTGGSVIGSGTLALNGNVTGNASSSTATISANVSLGSATRTFTIARGSAATDMDVSGVVSGTGAVTKQGAGILSLDGNNTFTGGLTVNAGTVALNSATASGTGPMIVNNATAQAAFTGSSSPSSVTLNSGTLQRTASSGSLTTFGSGVTVNATGASTLGDQGGVAGGGLVVNGPVNVSSGTLTLNASGANDSVQLASGQNVNIASGATLAASGSGTVTINRPVVGSGNSSSDATLAAAPNMSYGSSASAVVNGSGIGGLRVQGAASDVNNFLSSSRVAGLSGTGGTITYAYTDGGTANITAAPSANSQIALGFSGNGTYNIGAVANDLSTYNGLAVQGGTVYLTANEKFQGQGAANLEMRGGTLSLLDANGLPNTLELTGDANLSGGTLIGSTGSVGGQTGTLIVDQNLNSTGTAVTGNPALVMANASANNYIQGGTSASFSSITKQGTGTLTVNSPVSTPSLTVQGGTLLLGGNNLISGAPAVQLAGGSTLASGGYSQTFGTLTLAHNSTIDLGNGSSILQFADSSTSPWNGHTLYVDSWNGSISGDGTEQLIFGATAGGLTTSQLSEIIFVNPDGLAPGNYPAMILADGEVVPVPEAKTVALPFLLLAMALVSERKKLPALLRRA